jgi:SAM-dependent methyltransferase
VTDANAFQLYGAFGDRYDLHTPPHHYQHDHQFLIQRIQALGGLGRVLDIGCGTGVFLEKALAAGLDPIGLDPASAMLQLASQKVGRARVRLGRMQDLDDYKAFDAITALSWSLNYCRDYDELCEVLRRCKIALHQGGMIFLQVAHAPHAAKQSPDFFVDHEAGPGGPQDIVLKYRFWAADPQTMKAEYHFECISTAESFQEVHVLRVADARLVAQAAEAVGFQDLEILEDYGCGYLEKTFNPFVFGRVRL